MMDGSRSSAMPAASSARRDAGSDPGCIQLQLNGAFSASSAAKRHLPLINLPFQGSFEMNKFAAFAAAGLLAVVASVAASAPSQAFSPKYGFAAGVTGFIIGA